MRVLWWQDLDFFSVTGGAELTDRAHCIYGLRKGHEISLATPSAGDEEALFAPCDIVIVSNATAFRLEAFQRLQELGRPYAWFVHDYFPICRWRLFFPMNGKCRCYLKDRWLPILLGARLLIWLSPLHRESWLWAAPELKDKPFALVPSPVDGRAFHDLGLAREGVVAVNSMMAFKGRANIVQWIRDHPEEKVTLVGGDEVPDDTLPPNATRAGMVPQHQMNEVYNRHQAFLHLPSSPMPFDRTVAEAYLAGCRIIGNELIGALSWSFFREGRDAVRSTLANSPRLFWEVVEGALG